MNAVWRTGHIGAEHVRHSGCRTAFSETIGGSAWAMTQPCLFYSPCLVKIDHIQSASIGVRRLSVVHRGKDRLRITGHTLIMVAGELAITRNVPLDFYEPHCHGARGTPRVHARRFVFLNGQVGHVLPAFASQAGAYAGSQSPTPGGAAVGPISLTMVGYTSVQNGTPSHLYSNRATRRARCLSHRFSAELADVELATCPSPTSGDRTYRSYRSFGTAKLRSGVCGVAAAPLAGWVSAHLW